MNMMIRFFSILSMTLLFGCTESENTSTETKKTVIDHQIKALEKAKGVEQQLFDSASKQKEQIDSYE